jgi:hypothetical protein
VRHEKWAGPWTGGGGRGSGGRGGGVFIKARNVHPRPGSRLPRCRARGFSIYRPFPARRVPSPTLREGLGQSYCVPTARVITPRARVESQRGELRTGTGMHPRVSGSAIHRLFPSKTCPCPPQRGRRGQGCCVPTTWVINPHACGCPPRGSCTGLVAASCALLEPENFCPWDACSCASSGSGGWPCLADRVGPCVPESSPKGRAQDKWLELLAVLSIQIAHRVFGSNGNGPISSSMLRTASALTLALFLADMLDD